MVYGIPYNKINIFFEIVLKVFIKNKNIIRKEIFMIIKNAGKDFNDLGLIYILNHIVRLKFI